MFKKRVAAMLAMMLAFSVPAVSVFAAEQSLKLEQEVNDGRLEILEEGTYVLTGEMQGTIFVDPGEGDVELILDGVDIDGGASAGIIVTSGDSLKITLPDKTISRVTGGSEENPYRAAIYSEVPTTFEGNGSLYVNSADAYGIRTKDADLTFNGGSFAIKAQVDGMIADGRNAGVLTLNEDAHFSIQAWNEVAPKTNYVQNGAMIELVAPDNANLTTQVPFLPEKLGGMSAPDGQMPAMDGEMPAMDGQMPMMDGEMSMMDGQMPAMDGTTLQGTSDTASEIVSGTVTNSAANLEADYDNATYISVTDDESQVVITSSGTYVVTGSSSDGNITVKKGTTGVVLVLDNLDLTSTTGATVSINKEAEVKIIISGNVVLTDNENPDDENSTDEEVADAFDGAALKAKANSQVYVTGDGTLTINGNAKNGIKGGDESSLIFDGVTVNINAVNDGINGNYDVTLLSGTFTIAAGDDAIHADHILTIGSEDGTGPVINVTSSTEGLEATVINVYGGNI